MLKVTPEQLSTLSSQVARTSTDVRGAHQSLKGQLQPLFGADWSGAAAAHTRKPLTMTSSDADHLGLRVHERYLAILNAKYCGPPVVDRSSGYFDDLEHGRCRGRSG